MLAWVLSQTAQLKQCHEPQQKSNEFSSPSSSASSAMETQSSDPPPQPPPKESLARRYKFLWPMHFAVNVAVGSPFPFLIPQLCNLLFTLIYCVYFAYKVIKFIKWWYGFWDFSFKELFFKLIKCFSWCCFVDGYSVVTIGIMVLVLFPKDSLIQSQREGRRGYYD